MYAYLIRNNFPEGYRVLCHNCNQSLGYFGYCPHTVSSQSYFFDLDTLTVLTRRGIKGIVTTIRLWILPS
jgi:hypothetical protein